jgi:hypothetical protein
MTFELFPVIDIMLGLYEKPRTAVRFTAYLKTLQGNTKGDLEVPIGGFNPMAKEHAISKLMELKMVNAEAIIRETLFKINKELKEKNPLTFKVALNLSDDLKGGWTNRYTTDYDSKFKLNALITRNFCVPVFWTSEDFNNEMITQRTREYCYRSIYWSSHDKPKTLADHIEQEIEVAKRTGNKTKTVCQFDALNIFYEKNKTNSDWLTIFNFLYGDNAVVSLGNPPLGIKEDNAGFIFAIWKSMQ